MDLNDAQAIRKMDPEGMADRIAEIPRELKAAWEGSAGFSLPPDYRNPTNVVVLGLGGSAIGGDLVRSLVLDEAPVPIEISRDYCPPAYVGPGSLVIASSYSGNTEETLSAYAAARARGAKVVVVSTGGRISALADEHGAPRLSFDYKAQPRAAIAYSVVLLLRILGAAGLIADKQAEVAEAADVLNGMLAALNERVPADRNQAKQLALWLHGKLAVMYGAGLVDGVARRWKGQFNENAKATAFFDVLPELNHNTVVGYRFPTSLPEQIRVIFLESNYVHERVKARYGVTQQLLDQQGIEYRTVTAQGTGKLAQLMSTLFVGDWTSYYLAMLNGVDPTPVKAIDFLKEQLAKS